MERLSRFLNFILVGDDDRGVFLGDVVVVVLAVSAPPTLEKLESRVSLTLEMSLSFTVL